MDIVKFLAGTAIAIALVYLSRLIPEATVRVIVYVLIIVLYVLWLLAMVFGRGPF